MIMSIPDRLKIRPADEIVVARMLELLTAIEQELEAGNDAEFLLQQWYQHANREYSLDYFRNFWKSTSEESFVLAALNPPSIYDEELLFSEACAVIDAFTSAELPEHEIYYYLEWLEIQFPESNISDLIFWPDEWFGDASLFRDPGGAFRPESELTSEQMVGYAMARCGRSLPGTPDDLVLPHPLPPTE